MSPTSIPVLNSESYQCVVQGGETQEAPKGHPELRRCSGEPGVIKAARDHRTKYYRGDSCMRETRNLQRFPLEYSMEHLPVRMCKEINNIKISGKSENTWKLK